MQYYKVSKASVLGSPCVEHVDNPVDRKLFGQYGFIYETGKESIGVVLYGASACATLLPREEPLSPFEERIAFFLRDNFQYVKKQLRIPRDPNRQLVYAEEFDNRHLKASRPQNTAPNSSETSTTSTPQK